MFYSESLDEKGLCDSLMRMLKTDVDGARAEIISATDIPAVIVFEKYFGKQPPFGPAKKRAPSSGPHRRHSN